MRQVKLFCSNISWLIGILVLAQQVVGGNLAWSAKNKEYDGQMVLRVHVPDQQTLDYVLRNTDDVWSERGVHNTIDVRVTQAQKAALDDSGITYDVFIPDLQKLVDQERESALASRAFLDTYHTYEEVETFIDDMVTAYPGLCEKISFGQTWEGRTMWGVRISTATPGGCEPAVLYFGGQHAREWITVATTVYLIDHLLTSYGNDPDVTNLVDGAEWFILPIMNPDGYAYTWTDNRLWRKNRRYNGSSSYGVDLNRNWGGQGWGLDGGSSDIPAAETYRGLAAFSEPETSSMRDFILAHDNIRAICDIHSYSELVLWPWGYTRVLTPNNAEYSFVGNMMGDLIYAVHRHNYQRGPTYSTIYQVSGDSGDWAQETLGVLAFGFELRDRGQYGFLLPANQIIPNAEEITPALMYLTDWVSQPLEISLPNGEAEPVAGQATILLPVEISSCNEQVSPGSATLYFRIGSTGSFTPASLIHLSGDQYEAELPASCHPLVQYYLEASTTEGTTVTLPRLAPDAFFTLSNSDPITVTQTTQDLWRCPGGDASLAVEVEGIGPFDYQWEKDGLTVPNENNHMLEIPDIVAADYGQYILRITDACANTLSSPSIQLSPSEIVINTQPSDVSACSGNTVLLQVSASPFEAMAYQWYFDGEPIPGAVSHQLALTHVDFANTGEYYCDLTNDCVVVASETATVSLNSMEIVQQPLSICATSGEQVVISSTVLGDDLSLWWSKDGEYLLDENEESLVISSVTPADAGVYRLTGVTDFCVDHTAEAVLLVDTCQTCGSPVIGDFDGDEDRDLADFALFQKCFAPGITPSASCHCLDVSGDDSIDSLDFDLVGRLISGPQ